MSSTATDADGADPLNRRLLGRIGDWTKMRAEFAWPSPARFNMAQACCDSWAALDPGRVALRYLRGDSLETWTFLDLKRASDGLAASLRARGVGRGDRVAVLLAQSPEVLITHLAAYKLGAVALPLFVLFGPDALRYRLADSGAAAVVTDRDNLDKVMDLRADLPELREVYCVGGGPAPVRDLDAEIAAARPGFDAVQTEADDPAVLIYTSGTTGDPKGVLHAHRFLLGHLPSMEVNHEGFPREGDTGWTPADWAWIGGLMDMAMPCLYYGRPQLALRMRKFDPEKAFRLIVAHDLTTLFLPPTALKLMRQARVPAGLRVRSVSTGGEALGADLLDWARQALGAPINELYGQTECNLVIASCHAAEVVRPGSMGKPLPGFDVTLLDSEGRPAEQEGEIAVRRGVPGMFLRYWNKPDQTAAKFTGDWMRTGDLARRDADGYFWFSSRDDDVISSAGYRIGPSEIESCLAGHDDVVMAAVVGLPDPLRGEAVTAFVVLREGAAWSETLGEALAQRVRDRISPHVAPRRIEPVDALPMTATGKIMRRALRDRGVS